MITFPIIFSFINIKFTKKIEDFFWILVFILLAIIIGLKHEVGGDWDNYLKSYKYLQDSDFKDLLNFKDLTYNFGFKLFVWLSWKLTNSIYLANLLCAIIFSIGIVALCKSLRYPMVALSIAMPYLIIVAGLGYTRQTAALGLGILGLLSLKKSNTKFFIYILVGSLLHQSIIFLLLVAVLYNLDFKKNFLKIFVISIIMFILFFPSLFNLAQSFYSIDPTKTLSRGAIFRIGLSVVAVILFFYKKNEYEKNFDNAHLVTILSYLIIFIFFLSFFYSGAADRLHLYLMPLQIIIFTNFITLMKGDELKELYKSVLFSIYFILFFLWLNLGNYSIEWVPYKNLVFMNGENLDTYYREFKWVDGTIDMKRYKEEIR